MPRVENVAVAIQNARPVAAYGRVSTGRQAEGEVSLPSQFDEIRRYCGQKDLVIAQDYVEEGLTGTDDRRPAFQSMIERACAPDRPYSAIVVFSWSRFYRDATEMELCIRRLRKHGVEVVSVTQPTGNDPSHDLVRKIISALDEHTSIENGKNVKRAMKENFKQGFSNGATPPLGYKLEVSERRGDKVKKKLVKDIVEAELVDLIFRLYADGDISTGTTPLGIKQLCVWLNANGYTTKTGGTFGIGPLHHILTNTVYSGVWRYNLRSSKTGEKHPASEIVEQAVPAIIDTGLFDRVQAKLAARNPKVTPPRTESAPILLTGLATCDQCGGGMTQRTGTSSTGRIYSYYTCGAKAQKGEMVCSGNTIRMDTLDDLVVKAVKCKILVPERILALLNSLIERKAERANAVNSRALGLQKEVDQCVEKLKRIYAAIENGVVEIDDILKDRIAVLKADLEKAKSALARAKSTDGDYEVIGPDKITAFSRLMTGILDNAENPVRKAYLRTIIRTVVVGKNSVQISGHRTALYDAASGSKNARTNVRCFIPDWRTQHDSNVRPLPSEGNALSS